MKHSDYKWCKD